MNESPPSSMPFSMPASRRRFLWLAAGVGAAALGVGTSYWYRRDPLQQRPYPPATVGEQERCPVCGMYPARFPRWQAQLVLSNGERLSFDSLIEVFRYQAKHPTLDIADLYVSNYGNPTDPRRDIPHTWLPASEAVFVIGTTLKGPMNDAALPAFASAEAAQTLMQHAGGGRIVDHLALTPELKQSLSLRQH